MNKINQSISNQIKNISKNYQKDEPDNLFFKIFDKSVDKNIYLKNNIVKYSIKIPTKIKYISYSDDVNLIINNEINKVGLFVITNDTKFKYNYQLTPLYPILLVNNKCITLIMTSLHAEIINGFHNSCRTKNNYFSDFIYRTKKKIGAIFLNQEIDKINDIIFKDNLSNGIKKKYRSNIFKEELMHDITKNMTQHLTPLEQGWLDKNTKLNLEYAIKKFKPKIIVELGSWLGTSTNFISKLCKNITIYAFDSYQPIIFSPYSKNNNKYNPNNNFYFNVPRLETFAANLKKYKHKDNKIYTFQKYFSIEEVIDLFLKYKIKVDMFYIDFEKKTKPLLNILEQIMKNFPDAVIVGDDYGFRCVQQAIEKLMIKINTYNKNIGITDSSYIISNVVLEDYQNIITKKYRNKFLFLQSKKNIKNLIINRIEFKYQKKNKFFNPKNYGHAIKIMLNKNKYCQLLNFLKIYKISLNNFYLEPDYNNNIYHKLAESVYEYTKYKPERKIKIMQPFFDYENPEMIDNIFLMNYHDLLYHKKYLS